MSGVRLIVPVPFTFNVRGVVVGATVVPQALSKVASTSTAMTSILVDFMFNSFVDN
jgi:hypothetical protein